MTQFKKILEIFYDNQIEFVLIGGLAAVIHGSASATEDVDLSYDRNLENTKKIVKTLNPYHVRLRGAEDVPFIFDEQTFKHSVNLTLMTDLGAIDLLGEIPGYESYDLILADSDTVLLYDKKFKVLSLDGLIKNKKATGRNKDLKQLDELEELRKMQQQKSNRSEK
ncbi:MAG: hypothetical protein HYU97_03245 [Deltaproteobacteria bacterium]|nr:hypothetical protein [Deltaproteobacteria bacterium]